MLLSHDHYDHTDLQTLRIIAARGIPFVVPTGVGELVRRVGGRVVELGRWESASVGELMFRLDEMDETAATGMTEEEAQAFERDREQLANELRSVEARLGEARVPGLRAAHERDRAYAQQVRQIEEEGSE